jgi:cytochrome c
MLYDTNKLNRNAALAVAAGILCATMSIAGPGGDPALGRAAFDKRCTGCHTLDKIKIGPPLRGVYGRDAAKAPGFAYSDALKAAPVRWDNSTLDRWLSDTESLVPGNDMAFRIGDAVERANIIAYLKQLSAK